MKYLAISFKTFLFLLAIIVTYNLLSSITEIYTVPWYALYFENSTVGLFLGSFFWLQLMFFLRFPGIRFILLSTGGYGLTTMIVKIYTQHYATDIPISGWNNNWPSMEDVKGICFFCSILLVQGILFVYIVRCIDFIVVNPIKNLFKSVKQRMF
jgi:hypothetical protein